MALTPSSIASPIANWPYREAARFSNPWRCLPHSTGQSWNCWMTAPGKVAVTASTLKSRLMKGFLGGGALASIEGDSADGVSGGAASSCARHTIPVAATSRQRTDRVLVNSLPLAETAPLQREAPQEGGLAQRRRTFILHSFGARRSGAGRVGSEAAQGLRLIVERYKNGVQLGNREQVLYLSLRVKQLDASAQVGNGRIGADQFAQPGAIQVGDTCQVDQDVLVPAAHQFLDDTAD